MARKRGGTSKRSMGSKSTTVNKTFTPTFTLKGRSSKRSNGKSR